MTTVIDRCATDQGFCNVDGDAMLLGGHLHHLYRRGDHFLPDAITG
jgi:hypothetical protein